MNIKVDLRSIINDDFKVHTKYEEVEFHKEFYNLFDFLDEIEFRKDVMRRWLKENWDLTTIGTARIEEVEYGKQ